MKGSELEKVYSLCFVVSVFNFLVKPFSFFYYYFRSESEPSTRRKREKPKESTSPFRRKNQKIQEFKSKALVSTSDSSDSDSRPQKTRKARKRNSSVASYSSQVNNVLFHRVINSYFMFLLISHFISFRSIGYQTRTAK